MSSQLKPSDRFKKNMIILLEIISEMFEEASENKVVESDTKLLTILKVIINSTNGSYMINNFIKRSNKYWDKIRERDIDYFKNHGLELFTSVKEKGIDSFKEGDNNFVKNLQDKHIDNFKKMLEATYSINGKEIDIFDEERKEDIWKIMASFVKISISHVHTERNYENGKYSTEYFPEINIKENVDKWDIRGIKF